MPVDERWECSNCGALCDGDGVDETGSRRCDDLDPQHRYHASENDELAGLAILDITGVSDDVPGMPDFL